MSNIPHARTRLQALLRYDGIDRFTRKEIIAVLEMLDRERPEFTARRTLPTMTAAQVALACELRTRGWPLNRIATKLGTNIGRVSEAINGKRNGI